MRMMMFRTVLAPLVVTVSGKSFAARSKDRAIGVVPTQRTDIRVRSMSGMLFGLNATSRFVSSQSCLPG
jgi:hypothetical protein